MLIVVAANKVSKIRAAKHLLPPSQIFLPNYKSFQDFWRVKEFQIWSNVLILCNSWNSLKDGRSIRFGRRRSEAGYCLQICLHAVLRVLVCQETRELDDGRVEAAADVPPAGRRLLCQEQLGAAEVVDVDQLQSAGGRLDASEHGEPGLVAWRSRNRSITFTFTRTRLFLSLCF